MVRISIYFLITLVLLLQGIGIPVHAQSNISQYSQTDPITIRSFPENPAPGQKVLVTLESFGTDLNRATIVWSVNGKVVSQGTGQVTYTLTAGGVDSSQAIQAVVTTLDKLTFTKSLTLKTAGIDLIWQAHTYTPPFYKGKSLYPAEGTLIITAFSNFNKNGVVADHTKLVYTWRKNGDVISEASGYGRHSIVLTGSVISRPFEVSVTVSTVDQTQSGSASMLVGYQKPVIQMYEDNALLGVMYNKTIDANYRLKDRETTITASPYFTSTAAPHSLRGVEFKWLVNGKSIDPRLDSTQAITLRRPDGTLGKSNISVKTNSFDKILQFTEKSTIIDFTPLR